MSVTRANSGLVVFETFVKLIKDNLTETADGTPIKVVAKFPDNATENSNVTIAVGMNRYAPLRSGITGIRTVVEEVEGAKQKKVYRGQRFRADASILVFASSNQHRFEICGMLDDLFLTHCNKSDGIPIHDALPIQCYLRYQDRDIETLFVEDVEKNLFRAAVRVFCETDIYEEAETIDEIAFVSVGTNPIAAFALPPVAIAGNYQTIILSGVSQEVVLDGSESYSQGSEIVSYTWTQKAGKKMTINDANESIATLDIDTTVLNYTTRLIFQLTVVDANGKSSTSETIISCKL